MGEDTENIKAGRRMSGQSVLAHLGLKVVDKTACRFVCKLAFTRMPEYFELSGLFITWGMDSKVGFISLTQGLWSFSTFLESCMH